VKSFYLFHCSQLGNAGLLMGYHAGAAYVKTDFINSQRPPSLTLPPIRQINKGD